MYYKKILLVLVLKQKMLRAHLNFYFKIFTRTIRGQKFNFWFRGGMGSDLIFNFCFLSQYQATLKILKDRLSIFTTRKYFFKKIFFKK